MLQVGLVGAGPWASLVHAPLLAAGPETALAGVWSRTPDHAGALAATHGSVAVDTFEALLDGCEAVAFAVPPDVQADLAPRAAAAGKALLLEKPLGLDIGQAEAVAVAVMDAGVGALVVLSYRFHREARRFLEEAEHFNATGGRGCFLSGAFLEGPFAHSPWRQQHGPLLDVGPHILDLMDAALGPVVGMDGADAGGWVSLVLRHESGAVSDVALCCETPGPSRTEVELFGPDGRLSLDGRAGSRDDLFATLRRDFAEVARTHAPHPANVERALHIQRLIAMAQSAIA